MKLKLNKNHVLMKNQITFLLCALVTFIGMAQTDFNGTQMDVPERTPELKALYQQAKDLENTGTAAEINANRLAIKNAWQEVDPAVAALYKPIEHGNATLPNVIEGSYEESRSIEDWNADGLLRTGYIDGVDMDVTRHGGDIYIASFENYANNGDDAYLFVYRSTDNGNSFELWMSTAYPNTLFEKMQILTIDGNGEDYLLVYLLDDNGKFFVSRIKISNKTLDSQIIQLDVLDFGVDRNYPGDTAAQRVFATYSVTGGCSQSGELHSARSTAGSYGFDWVDETALGICADQVEFAYGRDGGCYTIFTGGNSGSLYANFNDNYNDPASWDTQEILAYGSDTESLNPTIRAARKAPSEDKVIVFTSSRDAGSGNHYDAKGYLRENGGSYTVFSNYGAGGGGLYSILQPDSWVRQDNGVETIRTSYVRHRIDDSENNTNRSLTFNGTGFDPFEPVADSHRDVFEGFQSVIAETQDNLPCMAFTGTDTGGNYGYNLYFDRKSTLGVEENELEGLVYYPNPAQDILNLSAQTTLEQVAIYSVLGKKVLQVSPGQKNATLNVSSLAAGIYLLKIEANGQTGTYKIIKE